MNRAAPILLAAALLVPALLPLTALAQPSLPPRVQTLLRQHKVPQSDVSIVVRDLGTGGSLLELNPTTARTPASTLKLLPTYAALDLLGPAYTWKTRAWTDAPVGRTGVLSGNLYLQGGGDPLMTIERWWRFVSDLRQLGLKRIEGNIVIDNTRFAPHDTLVGNFDGRPWRTYNVLPDGLLVNLQSSEFTFRPGADNRVEIEVDPRPANLTIENRAKLTGTRCRSGAGNLRVTTAAPDRLVISGTLSTQCPPQTVRRVIMTAPTFAYGTFVTLWKQLGGELGGSMVVGPTPATARLLHTHESITLDEVSRVTNKVSSNAMARTLVLTLGAETFGAPGTYGNGEAAIVNWLKGRGLVFPELVIDNGSGLSRNARISADSLGRLLESAYRSRYAPEFLSSLPLGGLDGTLRRRFSDISDASRIRMKTGSIDSVSSIAGYVVGASGKTYATVIVVNNRLADNGVGQAIQDATIRWVLAQ